MDEDVPEEQLSPEHEALEKRAIAAAEAKRLDEALEALNALAEALPQRAATYNNRAQVHQMRRDTDAALADLDFAVSLPSMPRKVGQQVYAQRGVLWRVKGDDERARADLERAGRLGNVWARQEAIKLNPYAAMCNAMLSRAMRELQGQPVPGTH
jgi:tetratricopeptide (TPR) repeat protein